MPLRAALYARVSTEDQAREGFSLDAQLEKLRAYCQAREWTAAASYVDDGFSGRDAKRPAYRRMMEERDDWDTILVLKMDRIHRNSKNFMVMMDRLRGWGKEFTSMQESLDTGTAMGRFVMDIIQRIAQLESEQIAERVYTGMEQKARSGEGPLGGPAPFGYRHEEGALAVVPEEAGIVQEIFRRVRRGEPMRWVAADLAEREGPSDRRWSVWSLRYLLQNPVYAGFLRWDGHLRRSDHTPLVPVDVYLEVLRGFRQRARSDAERDRLAAVAAAMEGEDPAAASPERAAHAV